MILLDDYHAGNVGFERFSGTISMQTMTADAGFTCDDTPTIPSPITGGIGDGSGGSGSGSGGDGSTGGGSTGGGTGGVNQQLVNSQFLSLLLHVVSGGDPSDGKWIYL